MKAENSEMKAKNSDVKLKNGIVPFGWPRTEFFSKSDNFSGVLTIVKAAEYNPTEEKRKAIQKDFPETFKSLEGEMFLTVLIDTGTTGQIKRSTMLGMYNQALKSANLPLTASDKVTVLHGYKCVVKSGNLSFINPVTAK